ncbi:MAG TPA: M50 family metallopeptidase [Chloroflexota bacterium]
MSKSTEDLIRELETGGVFEDRRAAPVAKPRRSPAVLPRAGGLTNSGAVMLVVATILIAVVGSLPFGSMALYPFALFVTLLHETGHSLAALATGGSVSSLQISSDLSGLTQIRGGIMSIIAPAGYLGATLAGVGLLLSPLRYARWVVGALTVVPLATLVLFGPADTFTAVWCAIYALALGVAAWKLPLRWLSFLQIFLGVEAGLNAFRDLMTLIFISGSNAHIQTDAQNMSSSLFLPATFWAVSWTVISVVLLASALVLVVRRDVASLRR